MNKQPSFRKTGQVLSVLVALIGLASCNRSPEAKTAKFMAQGKEYLEQKDPNRAVLQFRNAAQATPNNPEIYYQLALAYLEQGDIRQGVLSLRKTVEMDPKHRAAQLKLSQLMASVDDPGTLKDAQERLADLLKDKPNDTDALHALALTELKLGNSTEGFEHLQLALSKAPQDLRIAITLAQAKLEKKDIAGAEGVLKKFLAGSPNSLDGHSALADFYISQRKTNEAYAQLNEALKLDPMNGSALMSLAKLQYTVGQKQEAEQNFKKLSGLSGYESIYGTFLSEEGRKDEAVREFERLVKEHPDDRQIRTNLVVAYRVANRVADAKALVDQILRKNNGDLDALLQRAELRIGSGDYPAAEADLNKILNLQPGSPEVHYIVAKLNLTRGNHLIYRQQLAEALRLNPYLLPARIEAAQDLVSSNNGKAALDLVDAAPESQRQSPGLLVERNWALWVMGDMARMRQGIDQGLKLGKSADFLLQDGVWKLRAGQPTAARTSLEAALNLNPNDVRGLEALNQTYGPKEASVALARIREYATREPKSAPIQDFVGILLMAQGDRVGARRAFESAKSANPKYARADLALVQLDVLDGKIDEGMKRLNAMSAARSQDPTVDLWLGNLLTMKGDYKAAIEHFRAAVAIQPDNPQALNNLAYLLSAKGNDPNQALRFAQRAVEMRPKDPDYSDTLGWILYQKGLYDAATKYLEIASAAKGNTVSKYHLAMAYAKAGKFVQGRATLAEALKLNPKMPEAKTASELLAQRN